MTYSTGNLERDALIVRAIQEATACRDPITVESLTALLPPDFELDQDELDGMLSNMEPVTVVIPEGHGKPMMTTMPDGRALVPPETLNKIEAPHANETAEPHVAAAETTPQPDLPGGTYTITDPNAARVIPKVKEAEARRALDAARARLSKARDNMVVAKGVLRERRNDLANAITAWQLLGDNINGANDAKSRSDRQQAEIRNHLASTAADRAARAGRKNNSATRFAQRMMVNGPSRGAYDRSAAARSGYLNRDPNRGAVPKLPSER